jgi:hypothetical protein
VEARFSSNHLGCGDFVPPGRSSGGCLFPSLSRLWWLVFVFCFVFLFFLLSQAGKLKSSGPAWGSGGRSCHSTVVLAFSSFVFIVFSEPDLHNPVAFLKTSAPQPSSPSLSAPAAGSTVHAGCQSLARGLHAPESSLFFGARA